ncbi:MAG: peptidoglycan editing factor PgeF [Proteobacteria bacterium]|nr:peptidoglycan editing factor PgeF [Pseudomonadota bacterium]MDA1023438.1 peptidoglycan editing factor PgeF [Pseudomonadota bacterium]
MITDHALSQKKRISHAFFTRQGGVSDGVYGSLNCGFGSDDNPQHVARNRTLAMHRLGASDDCLATLYQIHSASVAVVDHAWNPADAPQADGAVTNVAGLALGILSADCAPVLLADADAGVIGAAHAGWKGALNGVVEATIEAMCALGAEYARITAAIGPCIQQASYEVGAEFHQQFVDTQTGHGEFFEIAAKDGHFMFDLPGFLVRKMHDLGLAAVSSTSEDTCADEARFFSYRRATHRGENDYGRGLSAIMLKD